MLKLGLSVHERGLFEEALRGTHERRLSVTVCTLEGKHLDDVSDRVTDGQVTVDDTAQVTRSLTLSLLDPKRTLNFDTNSPGAGALYADRMVSVSIEVKVPALSRWVEVPVFTGPVTKLDRSGDTVNVEAQGKEALALGAIWRPLTLKVGMRKTAALKVLLGDRGGETRFSFPEDAEKLHKVRSLDRFQVPWAVAQSIAESMNRQLYYTGDGVCTLRRLPGDPVWTFESGNGGDVVSDVAVAYELADFANTVVVRGGKPKGAHERVHAVAVAEATHALSPARLGRNGVPRHMVLKVDAGNITTKAKAQDRAEQVLSDRLRQTVDVTFDALPVPHLEPGDLVAVQTPELHAEFRLRKFTLPLAVSGAPVMSVGYHRKVTINRKRVRR